MFYILETNNDYNGEWENTFLLRNSNGRIKLFSSKEKAESFVREDFGDELNKEVTSDGRVILTNDTYTFIWEILEKSGPVF